MSDERSSSLHQACYGGDLDRVRKLLAAGADPNAPADPSERGWISCAGRHPRPLNCVAIAWAMTEEHVEITRLLLSYGAVADESVWGDHNIEMMMTPKDSAFRRALAGAPRDGSESGDREPSSQVPSDSSDGGS